MPTVSTSWHFNKERYLAILYHGKHVCYMCARYVGLSWRLYCDVMVCPELPEWCLVDEEEGSGDGEAAGDEERRDSGTRKRRREQQKEVC